MQAVIVNKTARDLEEQRRYYFTLPAFDPIAADTVFTLEMVLSVPQEKRFSEKVILLFVTDGSCRMDACNQE